MSARLSALYAALLEHGLRVLHCGEPTADWPEDQPDIQRVLVIGHGGSEFWPAFQVSPEFGDGRPDPLDRWSRRVISTAAPDMTFVAPSEGPPFAPIHALATGGALHPSPLGMLAHVDFGLWTAIRGLLLCADPLPLSPAQPPPEDQAFADCFAACPVQAFSAAGYDAAACARHLLTDRAGPCWSGCLARRACTLGASHAYVPDQAKFYMDAFTAAMERRGL